MKKSESIMDSLMNGTDKFLTTNQAAEYLGITPAVLRNEVHAGNVPYYKFGRRNRYLKSKLTEMILNKKGECYENK